MTSVSTDRRRGINSAAAVKVSCICATTGNITLSAEQVIDGITTNGTRVLVKNQTDATENGIYLSGASAWTREPDFNGTYDVSEGTIIPVSRGTVNAATVWRVTNTGTITVGTTELAISAQALDAQAVLSDGSVTYAADFLPATTQTHDLGSKTFQWVDLVMSGDIVQAEKADHTVTPAAGYGQFWTKNEVPSQGYYTDDAGNDIPLGLWVKESADHLHTPLAGKAEFWVKNDAPNVPYFTDDAGSDFALSKGIATVADHTRAGNTQVYSGNSTTLVFDVDADITTSTWTSVGPTGSGATYIWAGMDSVPSAATVLLLGLDATTNANPSAVAGNISVYVRVTGSSRTGITTRVLFLAVEATTGAFDTGNVIVPVPLDSSLRFDINWTSTNVNESITAFYYGFMTD